MPATFRLVGDHIVGEVFDGEAIIIDTLSGAYFSLEERPAEVWVGLEKGLDTGAAIAEAGGLTIEMAQAVLADLAAAGLVLVDGRRVADVAADADESGDGARFTYLTKYSDMEELLLLDPIHDVSPAGWPTAGDNALPLAGD